MSDWIRLSAVKPNSATRSSPVRVSDAESFEKKMKFAREMANRSAVKESPSADSALQQLVPIDGYNIHQSPYPCASIQSQIAADTLDPKRLKQKLQEEVFSQLAASDSAVSHGPLNNPRVTERQWFIDLSDLTEKNISINLTLHQNGKWSAALNTTTASESDPVLELIREQLTSLTNQMPDS